MEQEDSIIFDFRLIGEKNDDKKKKSLNLCIVCQCSSFKEKFAKNNKRNLKKLALSVREFGRGLVRQVLRCHLFHQTFASTRRRLEL